MVALVVVLVGKGRRESERERGVWLVSERKILES